MNTKRYTIKIKVTESRTIPVSPRALVLDKLSQAIDLFPDGHTIEAINFFDGFAILKMVCWEKTYDDRQAVEEALKHCRVTIILRKGDLK